MPMPIGELVRVTRERHGLSQARLARRIGSDRAYVSRVEAGGRLGPLIPAGTLPPLDPDYAPAFVRDHQLIAARSAAP